MSTFVTITVNPCIDISAAVPSLLPTKKLRCHSMKKEPGGGGINVSRVIKRLGGDTKAIYLSGGYTGEFFSGMLTAEGVDTMPVHIEADTRENFVVLDESADLQYRFGMPGPLIRETEWKELLQQVSLLEAVEYIIASGSLSEGMPTDFYARIAAIAKRKHIKFVLDTSGDPLRAAVEEGLYMIKPNLGELASISGGGTLTIEDAIEASRMIIHKKQAEVVFVSMAANGALLVTADSAEQVKAPAVKVKSTVGAGDSMVAGIVLSLSKGKAPLESLQYGVACGSATTLNTGTALCNVNDVERLYRTFKSGS